MHCNMRQPDAAQSLSDADAEFEVAQSFHWRLMAFILLIRYVTL